MGKKILAEKDGLYWKVNTMGLLHEIVECSLPRNSGVLKFPLNQFRLLLIEIAQRATELNDPRLNAICCRMALYSVSDPNNPEFDATITQETIKKGYE